MEQDDLSKGQRERRVEAIACLISGADVDKAYQARKLVESLMSGAISLNEFKRVTTDYSELPGWPLLGSAAVSLLALGVLRQLDGFTVCEVRQVLEAAISLAAQLAPTEVDSVQFQKLTLLLQGELEKQL